MLIAIIDCLAPAELQTLVAHLTRDGIVCLSSDVDICRINRQVSEQSDKPIVIVGPDGLNIPFDDCPRIWLCCGPDVSFDEKEAKARYHVHDPEHLARKRQAIQCGFRCMSYVDVLSFVANEQAKQCVKNMELDKKAESIVLRHVKDTTSYIL